MRLVVDEGIGFLEMGHPSPKGLRHLVVVGMFEEGGAWKPHHARGAKHDFVVVEPSAASAAQAWRDDVEKLA